MWTYLLKPGNTKNLTFPFGFLYHEMVGSLYIVKSDSTLLLLSMPVFVQFSAWMQCMNQYCPVLCAYISCSKVAQLAGGISITCALSKNESKT